MVLSPPTFHLPGGAAAKVEDGDESLLEGCPAYEEELGVNRSLSFVFDQTFGEFRRNGVSFEMVRMKFSVYWATTVPGEQQ